MVAIHPELFSGAREKIERAKEHISDFKAGFDAFLQTDPHRLVVGNDPNTGTSTVEVRLREQIPVQLSLILGDAIHNLRTALDHATWELIGMDRGNQCARTKFPMEGTQRDYEVVCNRIETPRDDTKKFLIAFAAYPTGGGRKLYALHKLDITDKHKILTPIVGVASIHSLEVINPNGQAIIAMTDCKFGMGPDGRARMMQLGRGLSIQLNKDSHPTIDIFFGDIDFFKYDPIVQTLVDLSDAVSDIVGQFEAFARTRG